MRGFGPDRAKVGLGRRPAAVLPTLALAALSAACVLDQDRPPPGLALSVTAPIAIPPEQAHAILQYGRLVGASNQLDPWCELEVRTLSGAEPRWITGGRFRVTRISSRLLLDATTRMPVLFVATSCSDPLFHEGIWRLASDAPSDVMYLRCIAPYYHCAMGPPLSPAQVQDQVGRYLSVRQDG